MEFIHKTVLPEEAVEYLNIQNPGESCEGRLYIDATAGGGGHSSEIAKRLGEKDFLISLDVDEDAIIAAGEKLSLFKNVKLIKSSYSRIPEILQCPEILKNLGMGKISGGVLFDLGVSFHQLNSVERGFSFSKDAPLDMRFDRNSGVSACEIVNEKSEKELADIFYLYGEERYSRRIAKKITEYRTKKRIETTSELAELVKRSLPFNKVNKKSQNIIHPATRVFQALRIATNNELEVFETTLQHIIHLLSKDARIVVISFHSLEDRIVKNFFKKNSAFCLCPKHQLICRCEKPLLEILTKKPVVPKDFEVQDNPCARSAKLRAAKKL